MKTRYGGGGHILDDQHALTAKTSYAKYQQRMLPSQDSITFYLLASEERMSRVKSGTQLAKAIDIQQKWFVEEKKKQKADPTEKEDIRKKFENARKQRALNQVIDQKKQTQRQIRNSIMMRQSSDNFNQPSQILLDQQEQNKKIQQQITALQLLTNIMHEDKKHQPHHGNDQVNFLSLAPQTVSSQMNQYIHAVQFNPEIEKLKLEHLDNFFLAKFQFVSDYLKEEYFKSQDQSPVKNQVEQQEVQITKQKKKTQKSNLLLPQLTRTSNLSFQDQV